MLAVALALAAVVATALVIGRPDRPPVVRAAGGSLGGEVVSAPVPAPPDAARRRDALLRVIAESETYIGHMLAEQDSVLRRWPERMTDPLRVYLVADRTLPDWRPGMREAVRSAFFRWERVSDVPIRFHFVNDSASAEVHVRWIGEFASRRTGQADIVWSRGGWIVRGTLTLAVRSPGGHILTDDAVHTVALHEIGHLLGLGHSDRPTDVMAPTTDVHDLTMRDRASARLLYELEPGSLGSRR